KTGNTSSVLRPFATQGSLVGSLTGPASGGPSQGLSLSILTEPHDELLPPHLTPRRPLFAEPALRNIFRGRAAHSGLMPANFTTLPHFSVSSAMNLPKSAGEPGDSASPTSESRPFLLASVRPALISLLSLPMIPAGVAVGTPIPYQLLAS